jgi:hypothetical protein
MENAKVPAPRGGANWSPATIKRILQNPALIGVFKWRGEPIDGVIQGETVLSVERFRMLQQRLNEIKENKAWNAVKLDYPPLKSMVFCRCGRRMAGCPFHGYPYYRCNVCRKPIISASWLWREVSTELKSALASEARLVPAIRRQITGRDLVEKKEKELRETGERIKFLGGKWDALYRLASPDYPVDRFKIREREIIDALNQAKSEKGQLEKELEVLRQRRIDEEGIARFCKVITRNLDTLTKDQWIMLLKMLKLKITVHQADQISVNVALPPIGEEVENQIPSL